MKPLLVKSDRCSLHHAVGDTKLAAELRRQARDELESLAGQLADPVLRAGLLSQPDAKAVLTGATVNDPPS
jgi:hypothetical protein